MPVNTLPAKPINPNNPSLTLDIPNWASTNPVAPHVIPPDVTQRGNGWVNEPSQTYGPIPPYQWDNWLRYSSGQWLNYANTSIDYFNKSGIPVWGSGVTYDLGSIVQDGTGRIYRSLQENNLAQNPATPASLFWASPLFGNGGQPILQIVKRNIGGLGSYLPPSNIVYAIVEMTAAGGNGGGRDSSTPGTGWFIGSGGGSGASATIWLTKAEIGVSAIPVAAGLRSPSSGGNGGDSFFGSFRVTGGRGGSNLYPPGFGVGYSEGGAGGTYIGPVNDSNVIYSAGQGGFPATSQILSTSGPNFAFTSGAGGGNGGQSSFSTSPAAIGVNGKNASNGDFSSKNGAGGGGGIAFSNGIIVSLGPGGYAADGCVLITEFLGV
jgi:hypothetical protein